MMLKLYTGRGPAKLAAVLCAILLLQGCAEAVVVSGMSSLVAMHDARTTKGMFHDQVIEKSARRALSQDPQIKDRGDISVTSYNRTVLITGQVRTKALKARAAKLVAAIDDVQRVHNKVLVSRAPVDSSWSKDSYITAKVKSRLFFRDFDATKVKVVSEMGDVYLLGLVTHAESDAVNTMVADISGAGTVTKMFEYVD
jgi:osmotically-inducible protein OsmY